MPFSRPLSQTAVLPLRSWFLLGSTLLLLAMALVLAILSARQQPLVAKTKNVIGDMVTPAIGLLSRPAEWIDLGKSHLDRLIHLREENELLREENNELLRWQSVAVHLERENTLLKNLLNVKPIAASRLVTARVVSNESSVFSRTLILDSGSEDGLKADQAIVADQGLVGRIIELDQHSAQVLLITDINSRLPVIVAETGERAILAGDNGAHPLLEFENPAVAFVAGQHVVTASDGGVFPSGIAVGTILPAKAGKAMLAPSVPTSRLPYVRALSVN